MPVNHCVNSIVEHSASEIQQQFVPSCLLFSTSCPESVARQTNTENEFFKEAFLHGVTLPLATALMGRSPLLWMSLTWKQNLRPQRNQIRNQQILLPWLQHFDLVDATQTSILSLQMKSISKALAHLLRFASMPRMHLQKLPQRSLCRHSVRLLYKILYEFDGWPKTVRLLFAAATLAHTNSRRVRLRGSCQLTCVASHCGTLPHRHALLK